MFAPDPVNMVFKYLALAPLASSRTATSRALAVDPVFWAKVQLVNVAEASRSSPSATTSAPPALELPELPLIVQFVTVAWQLLRFIAPPDLAEFPLNVELLIVTLVAALPSPTT